MIFSKSCEYALKSVIYLSANVKDNDKANVKEISNAINSPEPFTAKILQQLSKQKIVASTKGPNGGFYIEKSTKPITIYKVIEAIEGPEFFDRCILGLSDCLNKKPCPLHEYFVKHRTELKELFMKKTINDISSIEKLNLK
jgi:Rrf2 family protein